MLKKNFEKFQAADHMANVLIKWEQTVINIG
jgi:hypothetical protein